MARPLTRRGCEAPSWGFTTNLRRLILTLDVVGCGPLRARAVPFGNCVTPAGWLVAQAPSIGRGRWTFQPDELSVQSPAFRLPPLNVGRWMLNVGCSAFFLPLPNWTLDAVCCEFGLPLTRQLRYPRRVARGTTANGSMLNVGC